MKNMTGEEEERRRFGWTNRGNFLEIGIGKDWACGERKTVDKY
jgi:hypothetical protein